MDYLGHKTWGKQGEQSSSKLGDAQWSQLNKCFEPTSGEFHGCNTVILVSTVPLLLLGKKTKLRSHAPEEFQDQWLSANKDEQIRLFTLMNTWKKAASHRELLILAGNVNHGGYTDLLHKNQALCKQMITSGITQKPPSKWADLKNNNRRAPDLRDSRFLEV